MCGREEKNEIPARRISRIAACPGPTKFAARISRSRAAAASRVAATNLRKSASFSLSKPPSTAFQDSGGDWPSTCHAACLAIPKAAASEPTSVLLL